MSLNIIRQQWHPTFCEQKIKQVYEAHQVGTPGLVNNHQRSLDKNALWAPHLMP